MVKVQIIHQDDSTIILIYRFHLASVKAKEEASLVRTEWGIIPYFALGKVAEIYYDILNSKLSYHISTELNKKDKVLNCRDCIHKACSGIFADKIFNVSFYFFLIHLFNNYAHFLH